MEVARQQTQALIALLHHSGLPFVVVGGVAAVVHGSSLVTRDLDVVMPMTPAVLDRLLDALRPYRPHHALRRDLGPIHQDGESLSRFKMLLIDTDLGRLDVISEVAPYGGYENLEAIGTELVAGFETPVVSLDQLIEIKRAVGRPKDLIAVQELEAIRGILAGGDG